MGSSGSDERPTRTDGGRGSDATLAGLTALLAIAQTGLPPSSGAHLGCVDVYLAVGPRAHGGRFIDRVPGAVDFATLFAALGWLASVFDVVRW